MSLYYLYLSRPARALLPDALRAGYWGLSDETAHKSLERLGQPVTSLEVLHELQVDDQVLVGSGGPQARVPRGEWANVTLAEGFIWRVTSPYFHASEPPLESQPHRFGIEQLEQLKDITQDDAGTHGLDALHYSANNGGLLVRAVAELSPVLTRVGPLSPGQTEDPGLLALDGQLDAEHLTLVRREQRDIRARLFQEPNATCSICARTFPTELMRAAYIKPPSECSAVERRDPANIIPLCTLGCDFLFRSGDIAVDEEGIVVRRERELSTPAFDEQVKGLEGLSCSAHNSLREPFFQWHRQHASPV